MVERILLFKLVDPSTRDEVAKLTLRALSSVRALEELSVGVPADESSGKSWDLSVVMGFASPEDLAQALENPMFLSYLQRDMEGRYEVLKSWSFTRVEQV
jgi:Stress responsive A/B Barrel Domain